MSFLKRSPTYSAQQSSTDDPKATWLSARAAGSARDSDRNHSGPSCASLRIARPCEERTDAPQAAAKEDSNIDPAAIDAVKKMGAYLRTLKVYQVIDDITHDDVLEDGLIVQSDSKVDMLAAKPNRMRVEVTTDDKAQALSLRRKKLHRLGKARQLLRHRSGPANHRRTLQESR